MSFLKQIVDTLKESMGSNTIPLSTNFYACSFLKCKTELLTETKLASRIEEIDVITESRVLLTQPW
jgi:hypothetical protein